LTPEGTLFDLKSPVFILGCGRSGTTILGQALSKHPMVTYLNEPRHLWSSCFPETDIWTSRGKLVFTAADAIPKASAELRRLFNAETKKTGKPVLIEKLPINDFRLPFIDAIFPDARFIHIFRYGLEVASSIEKCINWFGKNEHKWHLLAEYALLNDKTKDLPKYCVSDYDRGLLEWRLSTESVYLFFQTIPHDRFMEITYDQFLNQPVETINLILSFLGLERNQTVTDFVDREVRQKSPCLVQRALTKTEALIAGELLAFLKKQFPKMNNSA
jgi:hypothetical protein